MSLTIRLGSFITGDKKMNLDPHQKVKLNADNEEFVRATLLNIKTFEEGAEFLDGLLDYYLKKDKYIVCELIRQMKVMLLVEWKKLNR